MGFYSEESGDGVTENVFYPMICTLFEEPITFLFWKVISLDYVILFWPTDYITKSGVDCIYSFVVKKVHQ